MNIILIVPSLKRSGPINVVYSLVSHLIEKKHSVAIISLYNNEPENSLLSDFLAIGVEVNSLNLSKYTLFFKGIRSIRVLVHKMNPDIVHSHGLFPDLINGFFLKGNIRVNTIHNYFFEDYPMKYGFFIGSFIAKLHVKAIGKLTLPIACSKTLSLMYKTRQHLDVDCVQNGIKLYNAQFLNFDLKNDQLSRKLGIPAGKRVILSVGSLIPRKDPRLLLDAFLKSHRVFDSVLVFLGDGVLMPELIVASQLNSSIVLLKGNVSNVKEYLAISDVFVTASKSEGLPNTVLEAMEFGLAIIASDIPQHQEIFESNMNACCFFKMSDLTDLISKLSAINFDTTAESGQVSRDIVLRNFSSAIMAEKYISKYNKINRQNL